MIILTYLKLVTYRLTISIDVILKQLYNYFYKVLISSDINKRIKIKLHPQTPYR